MRKSYIVALVLFLVSAMVSCNYAGKKATKKAESLVAKSAMKMSVKQSLKSSTKTLFITYSPTLLKALEKDGVISIFKSAKYAERIVEVRGRKVPLLVSPNFDPKLTVPQKFYGSWDPVKYHKGNPLYVKEGCETNLGRMKRGLAPVYYDANKINPTKGWGNYHAFELHHGGQKKSPDYFALMGEEHKTYSKQLHPQRTNSEILRNEFAKKERAPLYQDLADEIEKTL
jgi:hypothetical protein